MFILNISQVTSIYLVWDCPAGIFILTLVCRRMWCENECQCEITLANTSMLTQLVCWEIPFLHQTKIPFMCCFLLAFHEQVNKCSVWEFCVMWRDFVIQTLTLVRWYSKGNVEYAYSRIFRRLISYWEWCCDEDMIS